MTYYGNYILLGTYLKQPLLDHHTNTYLRHLQPHPPVDAHHVIGLSERVKLLCPIIHHPEMVKMKALDPDLAYIVWFYLTSLSAQVICQNDTAME